MKKVYLNGLKAVAGKVGSRLFRLLLISIEFNLKTRLMALILMTALLMPLILVGHWQRNVSAASLASKAPAVAAPISAPPEPFVLSSANIVSTVALSSITSLNSSVSGWYSGVINFFTAPQLPAEFALAKQFLRFHLLFRQWFRLSGHSSGWLPHLLKLLTLLQLICPLQPSQPTLCCSSQREMFRSILTATAKPMLLLFEIRLRRG